MKRVFMYFHFLKQKCSILLIFSLSLFSYYWKMNIFEVWTIDQSKDFLTQAICLPFTDERNGKLIVSQRVWLRVFIGYYLGSRLKTSALWGNWSLIACASTDCTLSLFSEMINEKIKMPIYEFSFSTYCTYTVCTLFCIKVDIGYKKITSPSEQFTVLHASA